MLWIRKTVSNVRKRVKPWITPWVSDLKELWTAVPYAWLGLFLVFPLALIVYVGLSEFDPGAVRYKPMVQWLDHTTLQVRVTFASVAASVNSFIMIRALQNSFWMALVVTFSCLALGYPLMYVVSQVANARKRFFLVTLICLPALVSSVMRLHALISLFGPNGFLQTFTSAFPSFQMGKPAFIIFGIVYMYLPLAALPLYNTFIKMDPQLQEAAAILGARPWSVFSRIVFPLSVPGLLAGGLPTFTIVFGEFVIPELLGGDGTVVVGRILWNEFCYNRNWPMACCLALFTVVFLLTLSWVLRWVQKRFWWSA